MDSTVINIITPPPEPVTINVIETVQQVTVNVSAVGEKGDPGIGALDLLLGEPAIGVINGSNATFTTTFNFSQIAVYINGLLQKIVTHYQTVGNNTIIFNDSPQVGDIILFDIIKL